MCSESYGSLCVCVCVCVCVLVPKFTSRMFIRAKINTAYLTDDADQMICGNFAINAYGVICNRKADSSLNATWNMT